MPEKQIVREPHDFTSQVDLKSTFKIGGTTVNATAAELNAGVDLSAQAIATPVDVGGRGRNRISGCVSRDDAVEVALTRKGERYGP